MEMSESHLCLHVEEIPAIMFTFNTEILDLGDLKLFFCEADLVGSLVCLFSLMVLPGFFDMDFL